MSTTLIGGGDPANERLYPITYLALLIAGLSIMAVLAMYARANWAVTLFKGFGLEFNGGPTALLVFFVYLALSLQMIDADEVAGAYFYGKALARVRSGLHFVPFGLMQVKRVPRTVQQFQAPGEPETVFKGDDRDPLPEGKVRPIRAVTRAPKSDEKGILDVQMTLDLNFVVRYQIHDIFAYVANFGSLKVVEMQLRDIGESTLAEKVTEHTPGTFIEALASVNETLVTKTEERFQNSGVDILSVRLISPDVSHKVSSAMADIPAARAKAQEAAITAEGEKTKRTKEGEGSAAAELAMLEAQAKGRKAIMTELKVDGAAVLASEAVRGLSDKTDVLVVGAEGGMRDVMGLVKGAQSALASAASKGATP